MKVLFIGDIHIKHNNIDKVDILQKKVNDLSRPVDYIVLAGDILDTHEKIDSQLMNRAYNLIISLRKRARVYVLVGNHDYINNQQFLTENHWMNGMKQWENVTIVDKPVVENGFVFMPYVPPGRFVEGLGDCDWRNQFCIFAHQEFKGCSMGAIESIDGDDWDPTWPHVISGHIHSCQRPRSNVYYPGSVINHAFGCDSQGLSLFNFSRDGNYTEERIDLGFVKKQTMFVTTKDTIPNLTSDTRLSVTDTRANIDAFKKSTMFKDLQKKKIKVVFKLGEPQRVVQPIKPFPDIFAQIVDAEKDEDLTRDYKTILL